MINYGKQSIDDKDIKALTSTLQSDWLTQGPKLSEFENNLAEYCGSKYAIAVCNGTAALHLANLVLSGKSNKNVITTPITFLATANSIIHAGGRPYFSDINYGSFTLDPLHVQKLVQSNIDFAGIIPVHLGGVVSDMEKFKTLANENDLWIIEDACHALGGRWIDSSGNLQKVGNCAFSDLTTFSFHPVKHITTGEGGAITTNSKSLYEKLLILRSHGMIKNENILNDKHGKWYYEMHDMGYNYRMTDFQASLGIEQLKKSDKWVRSRRDLVSKYDNAFEEIHQIKPQDHFDKDGESSYHLYIIQCEKRKELYEFLSKNGVNTQVHYIPIHLQPYYKDKYGYKENDFPVAEEYYSKALSLPLYPSLKESDQDRVISLIIDFYA